MVGERWRVGSAVLEVTDARIPCGVFRAWMGERGWVRRFATEARAGTYLRVVKAGDVTAGDAVHLLARPEHGITVGHTLRAFYGDRDALESICNAPGMPPPVRAMAQATTPRG